MRLRDRLFSYLDRDFSRDPMEFLALRLQYAGGMRWTVADGVLSTVVHGGLGVPLVIDLSEYTIRTLVAFLAAQPGYSLNFIAPGANAGLSALVLIDGTGDPALSDGDHLYGYTAPNWAFLEAYAAELQQAEAQIPLMALELSTTTADGPYLDLLGTYFGVPRLPGEVDGVYSVRIVYTVIQPKCNNVAMEIAIEAVTGQAATITDVANYANVSVKFDGSHNFDGSFNYDSASSNAIGGLFDLQVNYDILTGVDQYGFVVAVKNLLEPLRAAGTHLRALALTPQPLMDATNPALEAGDTLTVVTSNLFDGSFNFDGNRTFIGSIPVVSTISG